MSLRTRLLALFLLVAVVFAGLEDCVLSAVAETVCVASLSQYPRPT